MTLFPMFDVPVFWPILLLYWLLLFTVTMKRQIKHMIKYKYLPFSTGKKVSKDRYYWVSRWTTYMLHNAHACQAEASPVGCGSRVKRALLFNLAFDWKGCKLLLLSAAVCRNMESARSQEEQSRWLLLATSSVC